MKAIALLGVIFLAYSASACLWITGTKYNGEFVRFSGFTPARQIQSFVDEHLEGKGQEMESALRGSTNFNDRSDYAVALVYLGRDQEAIDLLQQLEKEQPGQYFVAANLGTAFELAGNNENALNWIQEGIHRNPDSHKGTEWLHVKILEAKISQQKDGDYFSKHTVLDLQPDQLDQEVVVDNKKISVAEVSRAIQYQLDERLKFVKPPDPAVAGLLYDYAAIEAATETLESAKGLLQLALEYGYPAQKIQSLTERYDQRIKWGKTRRYVRNTMIGVLVTVVAVYLLYLLRKSGHFVFSRRELKKNRSL